MGNTQPKNKTGRKVVQQKLENAKKTGILSLSEHNLGEHLPDQIFEISALTTLDVSKNNLKALSPKLGGLSKLKTLNCQDNKLPAGSLVPISKLPKLQTLLCGGNRLEYVSEGTESKGPKPEPFPAQLPASLKQIGLERNSFTSVPLAVLSPALIRLERLDLSNNRLVFLPEEVANLGALTELTLDNNSIVSLPDAVGRLPKLKVLSLRNNKIAVHSTVFSAKNPQPLPASLFTETLLIDLNLHGNKMTSTQLNRFEGYPEFLDRREKGKTKGLYGGALTNLDVCGLE